MNCLLKVGDSVRVCRVPGSPWQASLGIVVQVVERSGESALQEYAVRIEGNLRWFMAEHLVKTVSPKWIRFFRNEVMERWRLTPDETCGLNGDREELIELLRDHRAFSVRRAEAEVDEFYGKLDETIGQTEKLMPSYGADILSKPQTAA